MPALRLNWWSSAVWLVLKLSSPLHIFVRALTLWGVFSNIFVGGQIFSWLAGDMVQMLGAQVLKIWLVAFSSLDHQSSYSLPPLFVDNLTLSGLLFPTFVSGQYIIWLCNGFVQVQMLSG